jgi:hypothetical protein
VPTEIDFPAADGITLPGVLTVPRDAHRRIVSFFRVHLDPS